MSYSSFKTLARVQSAFGLELDESQNLFAQTKPRQPSDFLGMANENIKGGLAQCLAEMVAVREFNAATNHITLILGAVTTGTLWKFLTLNGQVAAIDLDEYYIKEVAKILGILATPLQQFIRN